MIVIRGIMMMWQATMCGCKDKFMELTKNMSFGYTSKSNWRDKYDPNRL